MGIETVEIAIETRVKTLFEDTVDGVPIDYGQKNFKEPVTPWCRLTVLGGTDNSVEIDATSYQMTGILTLQIFTPEGERRKSAKIYDILAALFRDKQFDEVSTATPSRTVVGLNNGWWQVNCAVDWEHLEVN